MSWYVVDTETDGPLYGVNSMICFGIVRLDRDLKTTFYGQVAPISNEFIAETLAVSGITREQHLTFPDPQITMGRMQEWIAATNRSGKPTFVSDNPAFDFAWINYYSHRYLKSNPFGHSARRIGDLYAGFMRNSSKASEWKKFRKTMHTHDPVDDAMGNAEALLHMAELGLKIPL